MTADLSSFPPRFFWASAREVHLSFEVDLFQCTTCPALDLGPCIGHMCQEKEAKAPSLLCNRLILGVELPPLGGRINGLAGRYTPPTKPSALPEYASQCWQPCGRTEIVHACRKMYYAPPLWTGAHTDPIPPWPLSNERESGCQPAIGCIFQASHWLERGWAGS